jgi:microcystin-dependent protein
MRTRYQNLRSSTALARPAAGSGLPGQFWVNMADQVVGWFDDAGAPVALPFVKPPALAAYLPLAGGTMTGALVLAGAPTQALNPATKAYADAIDTAVRAAFAAADTQVRNDFTAADAALRAEFRAADTALGNDINALATATSTALATKLALAGGTMTGPLVLAGAPTQPLQAATKKYVDDQIAAIPAPVIPPGTIISDTPPADPKVGQLWFKTVEPVGLYIWYQDADSSQWVQVSGGGSGGGGGDTEGGDATPIGTVSYFAGDAAPDGWIVCDGTAVTELHPDLRQHLLGQGSPFGELGGHPLRPDLRGEFIRGWDAGRGVDPGRALGSAQSDDFKSHTHPIQGQVVDGSIAGGTTTPSVVAGNRFNTTIAAAVGGTETRPRNVALLPCIKASNAGASGGGNAPQEVTIVQGATGWQVVGDVLICWGADQTIAAAARDITYPKAFKTNPVLGVTPFSASGVRRDAHVFARSTTGASIVVLNETGTIPTGASFFWTAIGEALDADKMPKKVGGAGGADGADFASPAEALAGVRPDVVMSPATTKTAIDASNRLRAWLSFNGTGNANIKGENLSGVRTATGEFSFTFGEPMPDTSYAVTIGIGSAGGGFGAYVIDNKTVNGFTVTVNRVDVATVRSNPTTIDLAVFG